MLNSFILFYICMGDSRDRFFDSAWVLVWGCTAIFSRWDFSSLWQSANHSVLSVLSHLTVWRKPRCCLWYLILNWGAVPSGNTVTELVLKLQSEPRWPICRVGSSFLNVRCIRALTICIFWEGKLANSSWWGARYRKIQLSWSVSTVK